MTIEGPRDEKAYTEFQTRRDLIDKALERLNWARNVDWVDELELRGMPNHSEVGYADCVLFGDLPELLPKGMPSLTSHRILNTKNQYVRTSGR